MTTRRKRWLWTACAIVAVGCALAAGGIWLLLLGRQPAWLAIRWPIDLSQPLVHLADWRLRALQSDRALCRLVLKAPYADAVETPDAEAGTDCGWRNSVRLSSLSGSRIVVDKMTCELTAAMALWIAHDVQPAAEAIFGERISSIRHLGGYACRNIRGSPAFAHVVSEHARANALDIAAFQLVSGRQVSVLKHWGQEGADGRFLALIHSRACKYFRVAIGPAYNAAHRDHFHYDRGIYSACR